jgi:hypothetical protein
MSPFASPDPWMEPELPPAGDAQRRGVVRRRRGLAGKGNRVTTAVVESSRWSVGRVMRGRPDLIEIGCVHRARGAGQPHHGGLTEDDRLRTDTRHHLVDLPIAERLETLVRRGLLTAGTKAMPMPPITTGFMQSPVENPARRSGGITAHRNWAHRISSGWRARRENRPNHARSDAARVLLRRASWH